MDDKYIFLINKEQQSTRLDLVLSLQFEEISRSFVQKLIEIGNVKINGESCLLKKYKVREGDWNAGKCNNVSLWRQTFINKRNYQTRYCT